LHGCLGDKIKDRGGRKSRGKVGRGEYLRRWHAADISETVTDHLARSNELLHVQVPVLKADEILVAIDEASDAVGRIDGVCDYLG
jgi:hypothetical protein